MKLDPTLFKPYVKSPVKGIRNIKGDKPTYLFSTKDYIILMYGKFNEGVKDSTQPKIFVLAKEIDMDTGEVLEQGYCFKINSSSLGQMRIGTVWTFANNGTQAFSKFKYPYKKRKFLVDFSSKGWKKIYPEHYEPYLIPSQLYDIESSFNHLIKPSPLLAFNTKPDNKTLYVPCFELFHWTYGSSAELKRKILTYKIEDFLNICTKPFTSQPNMPNKWIIRTSDRLTNKDALFLVFIKNDTQTYRKVKAIHSQLEAQVNDGFIWISPWFHHIGSLTVSGLELPNGGFFALRVEGFKPPDQKFHRVKKQKVIKSKTDGVNDKPDDGETEPVEKDVMGEGFGLEQDEPPKDPPGNPHEIDDDEIVWEDDLDVQTWIEFEESESEGAGKPPPNVYTENECDSGSMGEYPDDTSNNLKSDIRQPNVIEVNGTLTQIWKDFKLLQLQFPDEVNSVEYYDSAAEKFYDSEPTLIPFDDPPGLTEEEKNNVIDIALNKTYEKWTYNGDNKRGLLVLKVSTRSKVFYIFEIERRLNREKNGESNSFKGLAFQLGENQNLEDVIDKFFYHAPRKKGIVDNFIEKLSASNMFSYPHINTLPLTRDEYESIDWHYGFAYAINSILNRMGIDLKVSIPHKIKRARLEKNQDKSI